jgi:hypothetical protein
VVDQARANAKPRPLGPSPDEAPMGYNRLDIGSTAYKQSGVLANRPYYVTLR